MKGDGNKLFNENSIFAQSRKEAKKVGKNLVTDVSYRL